MTLTKEWLQQTIAELEEERDAIPGAVNEDAAMALSAMKLALASLTAEPVAWDYEWASYITCEGPQDFNRIIEREAPPEWAIEEGQARNIIPLYTAPPAQVSVPTFEEWCERTGQKPVGWVRDAMKEAYDACRAAMLQGAAGNSPAIPDGYALVPVEPTVEMQSAAASAIRFETTPINKLWTGNAVYKAMLAAVPQLGR